MPAEERADTTAAAKPPGGWDPYEVWRTRVLLPRNATGDEAEPSASERIDEAEHPQRRTA